MNDRPQLSRTELHKRLVERLHEVPECGGAKLGPIIQRDIPGRWVVALEGKVPAICLRHFIAVRAAMQDEFDLQTYRRGQDD